MQAYFDKPHISLYVCNQYGGLVCIKRCEDSGADATAFYLEPLGLLKQEISREGGGEREGGKTQAAHAPCS